MLEQDWIILRLLMEIDSSKELGDDSIKATLYLIQKYGREKVWKSMKLLKKEKKAKMDKFDELLKDYLRSTKK
jgi:hypothetical protein